jgi:hypothetical protein
VVSNYLGNHGRRVKKADKPGRTWSLTQVVGKVLKEDVEELCAKECGHPKGSSAFFAAYQKFLSNYVTALPEEDKTRYQEMAREWTARAPPEKVQQQWVFCLIC